MAWTLGAKERGKVRQVFISMDVSYSGILSLEHVSDALGRHGLNQTEITKIFDALDIGSKGHVRYSDFLASMCVSGELLSQQRLDEVFDCLDCDRDGTITLENIRELSKSDDSLSTCASSLSPTISMNSADFAATLRSAAAQHG